MSKKITITPVHISTINPGDTVKHNGEIRTINAQTIINTCRVLPPTPDQVRWARHIAKQTQKQAANTVYRSDGARWREWESGKHRMDSAIWELYLIKTGQQYPVEPPPP